MNDDLTPAGDDTGDVRDELPDDLNMVEFAGIYDFPDNSRRRRPAVLYVALAAICLLIWVVRGDGVLVNRGLLYAAVALVAIAIFSYTSGWHMNIDEHQALDAAQHAVGFPIGHASAQQVWRGVRSRPAWRILIYSVGNPPLQRGLVMVDAIDGTVYEHMVEANPEEAWPEDATN
ncbi:MAG: hypothetical protein ABIQ39_05850 [Ilumatobacteraceae bacterium]